MDIASYSINGFFGMDTAWTFQPAVFAFFGVMPYSLPLPVTHSGK